MKEVLHSFILFFAAVVLAGCQSDLKSAPPVTESFIRAGLRENADGRSLAEGRRVFLNRCILCHALPKVARFDAARLTAIVATMSGRANLNPEQREAVLKYLLTVRRQSL